MTFACTALTIRCLSPGPGPGRGPGPFGAPCRYIGQRPSSRPCTYLGTNPPSTTVNLARTADNWPTSSGWLAATPAAAAASGRLVRPALPRRPSCEASLRDTTKPWSRSIGQGASQANGGATQRLQWAPACLPATTTPFHPRTTKLLPSVAVPTLPLLPSSHVSTYPVQPAPPLRQRPSHPSPWPAATSVPPCRSTGNHGISARGHYVA